MEVDVPGRTDSRRRSFKARSIRVVPQTVIKLFMIAVADLDIYLRIFFGKCSQRLLELQPSVAFQVSDLDHGLVIVVDAGKFPLPNPVKVRQRFSAWTKKVFPGRCHDEDRFCLFRSCTPRFFSKALICWDMADSEIQHSSAASAKLPHRIIA